MTHDVFVSCKCTAHAHILYVWPDAHTYQYYVVCAVFCHMLGPNKMLYIWSLFALKVVFSSFSVLSLVFGDIITH